MRKPIRTLGAEPNAIYLTFDDGPDENVTPKLLNQLESLSVKSTFFVIGQKALAFHQLIIDMQLRGHTIGDHTWDHNYRNFFGRKRTHDWIQKSHERLTELIGQRPVGMRSPAGIITPPLLKAVRDCNIPLIHWNRRCFDTRFSFTRTRALALSSRLRAGDIVLLHDGNNADPKSLLSGVQALVEDGTRRGFRFLAIQREYLQ